MRNKCECFVFIMFLIVFARTSSEGNIHREVIAEQEAVMLFNGGHASTTESRINYPEIKGDVS